MEFVSQRGRRHADYGCGVASLLMLLKHSRPSVKISYQDLARRLRIDKPVKARWGDQYEDAGYGAYPADITLFLKEEGIAFIQLHDTKLTPKCANSLEQLVSIGPVMMGMDWGESGHWIVVIQREGNDFTYFDPYNKVDEGHIISKKDLLNDWDGFAVQVL